MVHLLLHLLVPLLVAWLFYPEHRVKAFVLLMFGMVIDLDHLLANPIYDANRCSIGFHPLHSVIPIGLYLCIFAHEKTRLVGLGLCVHILLDSVDCLVMNPPSFTYNPSM